MGGPIKGNLLTDAKIRGLKPKKGQYLESDGNGLYLRVNPTGSKAWVVRYYVDGKSFDKTIGENPAVTLKQARIERDEIKARVRSGMSPTAQHLTFRETADEWYKMKTGVKEYAEKYLQTITYRLEHYIFPYIGSRFTNELEYDEVLKVLDNIAMKGNAETARKCAEIIQQVFVYARNHKIIKNDPMTGLRSALPMPEKKSFRSVKDPAGLGLMLDRIYRLDTVVVRAACSWSCIVSPGSASSLPRAGMRTILIKPSGRYPHLIQSLSGSIWYLFRSRWSLYCVSFTNLNKALSTGGFLWTTNTCSPLFCPENRKKHRSLRPLY